MTVERRCIRSSLRHCYSVDITNETEGGGWGVLVLWSPVTRPFSVTVNLETNRDADAGGDLCLCSRCVHTERLTRKRLGAIV